MTFEPLQADLHDELKEYAEANSFKHIAKLLGLLANMEKPVLSEFDKEQLVTFTQHIKLTYSLKYPYWNDDLDNYSESDENEYLEIMNGLYQAFASWLYDELDLAVGNQQ